MAKAAVRWSFSPADIAGLVLHVDARTGVYADAGTTPATDGQTVQQWNDTSGTAHHVSQATAGNRPTYRASGFNGRPGVEFADDKVMATASFLGAGYNTAATLFWIGANSGTNSRMALTCNDQRFSAGDYNEWARFDASQLSAPPSIYHGAQAQAGNYRCVGMSYDGATLTTIINGQLVKRERTGNLGLSGAVTVGDYATLYQPYNGCIAEAFMWNAALTDDQMRKTCRYLLHRWVLSELSPRRVICYTGDSQTAYAGVAMYPQMIAADIGYAAQSHTSTAQGGVTLSYINQIADGWVDPVYDPTAALNINVIWAGTNDLSEGDAAADVHTEMANYCAARRAAGWDKIVVLTALPRSAAGDNAGCEALRIAYNTLVRNNYAGYADELCDVAADGRIGDGGDEQDTTYYNVDRVHLNSTGQGVIAELLQPVIEGLLA